VSEEVNMGVRDGVCGAMLKRVLVERESGIQCGMGVYSSEPYDVGESGGS
jgi:hypothetical protein